MGSKRTRRSARRRQSIRAELRAARRRIGVLLDELAEVKRALADALAERAA